MINKCAGEKQTFTRACFWLVDFLTAFPRTLPPCWWSPRGRGVCTWWSPPGLTSSPRREASGTRGGRWWNPKKKEELRTSFWTALIPHTTGQTGPFTVLEPQDRGVGNFYVVQESRTTDFEASKLWKGPSGALPNDQLMKLQPKLCCSSCQIFFSFADVGRFSLLLYGVTK